MFFNYIALWEPLIITAIAKRKKKIRHHNAVLVWIPSHVEKKMVGSINICFDPVGRKTLEKLHVFVYPIRIWGQHIYRVSFSSQQRNTWTYTLTLYWFNQFFDSLPREGLWWKLLHSSIDQKLLCWIRMLSKVFHNGVAIRNLIKLQK